MSNPTQHAGPDERSEFIFQTKQTCSECLFHGSQEDCEVCGGEVNYMQSVAVPEDTLAQIRAALLAEDKGGEVFGWYLRADTYAPVFREQRNPPEPLTREEALASGWRPVYTNPQQAAQAAVPQWQPIETAPRDGTVILVTDTFTYRSDPDKKPRHVYRAVRWNEEGYGWEIYNDGEIIDQDGPTFWMPLPAEPGAMLSAAPVAAQQACNYPDCKCPTETPCLQGRKSAEPASCTHVWDGPTWRSVDGRTESATCSRCEMRAIDHSLRTGP